MSKGYIVTRDGNPVEFLSNLDGDDPAAAALLWGSVATVFPTRWRASGAIRQTFRFASARGLDWDQSDPSKWCIWALREATGR